MSLFLKNETHGIIHDQDGYLTSSFGLVKVVFCILLLKD